MFKEMMLRTKTDYCYRTNLLRHAQVRSRIVTKHESPVEKETSGIISEPALVHYLYLHKISMQINLSILNWKNLNLFINSYLKLIVTNDIRNRHLALKWYKSTQLQTVIDYGEPQSQPQVSYKSALPQKNDM